MFKAFAVKEFFTFGKRCRIMGGFSNYQDLEETFADIF